MERYILVRSLTMAAIALLAVVSSAEAARSRPKEELINPLLSPEYSLWLVGPIGRMAKDKEVEAYLRATDDESAAAVIEEFWKRRDPEPRYERNPLRERFDERVAEADQRYREAGSPGRRTDRGTIFILYGEPKEIRYDIAQHPDDPPVEVWEYGRKAEPGLDGEKPARVYRFIRRGDRTTFFTENWRPPRRTPFPTRRPPRERELTLAPVGVPR